jgi:hypothetical protein
VLVASITFAGVFAVAITLMREVSRGDLDVLIRALRPRREPQVAP